MSLYRWQNSSRDYDYHDSHTLYAKTIFDGTIFISPKSQYFPHILALFSDSSIVENNLSFKWNKIEIKNRCFILNINDAWQKWLSRERSIVRFLDKTNLCRVSTRTNQTICVKHNSKCAKTAEKTHKLCGTFYMKLIQNA